MAIINDIKNWLSSFSYKKDLKELGTSVEDYQYDMGLPMTDKLDESVIRRLELEKEYKASIKRGQGKYLLLSDNLEAVANKIFIDWPKVITFKDDPDWALPKSTYREKRSSTDIKQFITHWDVCLNSVGCFNILKKRGLSVHFLIDNDGTIIQIMPILNRALHAGNAVVNQNSIGVEISNAYYTKYQKWYEDNGFGKRPVLTNIRIQDKILEDHLGFYPIQIKALKSLMKSINDSLGIPLYTSDLKKFSSLASKAKDKGFFHHYHVNRNKIDAGSLDLQKILDEIKEENKTLK